MYKITSKELRDKWIKFYESKGHVNIGAASLIGDGTTGVMFNVAGMQPLMPYLLGQPHKCGKRLCNVQGCVRTLDIESVGDISHFTFFEMMGNWSLGDYFKKEKTAWTIEFLTEVLGLDKNKLCATVFAGDADAPRDDETASLLMQNGIKKENIFYLPKADNWWELEGTTGTPCGPDNEWFYPIRDEECGSEHCDINCKCKRFVEIGNDVYMQYKKLDNGYEPLSHKNVDTGFGLDRMLLFLNGLTDSYKTDLFIDTINLLQDKSGHVYGEDEEMTRAMRIIADHMRTSVMLIGDINGIVPSNVGAGYILRRIMRRAIREARILGVDAVVLIDIARIYIEKVYVDAYPLLVEKEDYIVSEIQKEIDKFDKMLTLGEKEFDKMISGIIRHQEFAKTKGEVVENIISGKSAFRLYETFGFPLELTCEMAEVRGFEVDKAGFDEAFHQHQELAKTARAGEFKGGLQDDGTMTTRLHTAVHLMNAGLRKYLGNGVYQKGSNITSERARFDFSYDKPMTKEEIQQVEDYVNEAISKNIPVVREEMKVEDAKNSGAIGVFDNKYQDTVSVYTIPGYSKEICGGPHAKTTGELGKFKIIKECSSSSGVRRIKCVLEPSDSNN